MSRVPGRDIVTVLKKGVHIVDEFNKDVRRNTDHLGPGVYHQEEEGGFGDQVLRQPDITARSICTATVIAVVLL